jgi:energy-converting hydrogenase Eha subunit A
MEQAFQPQLWRDLYVMLGTSAAALIGLLFVVTSLHLDEIMTNPVHRIRARNMTFHLLVLLVEATLILTPQPMLTLGVELVAINLFGLQLPLRFIYQAFYKNREMGKRGAYSIYRGMINLAGYLLGIAAGASLIDRSPWGMYLITASFIAFLVSAILNAWTIMSVVGQSETAPRQIEP